MTAYTMLRRLLLLTLFYKTCDSKETHCRDSWLHNSSMDEFRSLTCAKCFTQVFFDSKNLKFEALVSGVWPPVPPYVLVDLERPNISYVAEEETGNLCDAADLSGDECLMWKQCCQQAVQCCQQNQHADEEEGCPATWDGVACWGTALPGRHIYKECPSYYLAPAAAWRFPLASKKCDQNGTWEVHSEHGLETTDYTKCFDTSVNVYILRIALCIDFVGNSVSVLALATAIILVSLTRPARDESLSRDSQKMHINLFVAVMCTGASVIPLNYVYLEGMNGQTEAIYIRSPAWCRMLYAVSQYFRSAVYLGMFSEGLYLHRRVARLMYVNLRDPVLKYIVLTWGLPAITVTVYVIVRLTTLGNNHKCWMDASYKLEFIHMMPNIIALVANVFFLASIEYHLCTSMRSDTTDRRIHMLRQALRASLSLVPVFGLQFVFLFYRPRFWPPYEVISACFSSTQGLVVSILYCFAKQEIRQMVVSRCGLSGRSLPYDYTAPPQVAPADGETECHQETANKVTCLCSWANRYLEQNGLPDVVMRDLPGRKFSKTSQNTAYTHTTSVGSSQSWSSSEHFDRHRDSARVGSQEFIKAKSTARLNMLPHEQNTLLKHPSELLPDSSVVLKQQATDLNGNSYV